MAHEPFEPDRYKRTSEKAWEDSAGGWHRWSKLITEMTLTETRLMFDLAHIEKGSRVLDVAAGDGATSLLAAERVGPDGHILATDISAAMVRYAASSFENAGLENVEARVMDGENLDLPDGIFDAVICRLGLMLMPNAVKALGEFHRVLRPGGRFAVIVISTPEKNPWLSVPAKIAMEFAGMPPPGPNTPGPFSLAVPGRLEHVAEAAGFHELVVQAVTGSMRFSSVEECLQFVYDTSGGIHAILAREDQETRQRAWDAIGEALKKFEAPDGFVSPVETIIAAGVKA